jgi:ABC-type lipoprotein release transport system permease subunit
VIAAGRVLSAQLYEVSSHDPAALGGTAATVAVVALIASLVPAFRAASVEPVTVLRGD